ncbi:hypothetical protein PF008_g25862 [Phytophthora fragariae]|uniref:Uncharacterized protein n=1 Tax=Phytophthora fragariae TaxID=53985 RepID=A0A6G0QIR6_9STRA|nr:hypothetical protein PF008_g25862 [Phytophthora fragariae]
MHGERTWRDRLQAKWATAVHAARAASASFFDLYRWGRAPRPAAAAPAALPGSMKPRLKGSQAGYCSIATTTSSIAGIDEAPRPAAAAPAAAAALPGSMKVSRACMRFICGCLLIAVLVLRATSPATSSSGAGSIAGVDEAPPERKPSWLLQHRHHDQQHCRHRRSPATSSSGAGSSSSSSIAGVDEAPRPAAAAPAAAAALPGSMKPRDQQQQQQSQ